MIVLGLVVALFDEEVRGSVTMVTTPRVGAPWGSPKHQKTWAGSSKIARPVGLGARKYLNYKEISLWSGKAGALK